MKIQQLVDNVHHNTLKIPPFQRGFVWNEQRIVSLMDSLYRRFPIGIITTWQQADSDGHAVELIVDGQQRIASIYACYTGKAPPTYQENDKKPKLGIHFHVKKQKFGFPGPRIRETDPMWVQLSNLFGDPEAPKTGAWRARIRNSQNYHEEDQDLYDERINRVKSIRDREIALDQIESRRTTDEVVEMFDRINSQGTKLKREELEIARMSVKWPDAKEKITAEQNRQKDNILRGAMREAAIIRNMHAAHRGQYQPEGLKYATADQLQQALKDTARCNTVMARLLQEGLGMYDPKSIRAVLAFPALTYYLKKQKGYEFPTRADQAQALAYVLISNATNAYRSFTDTAIDADIKAMEAPTPWETLAELIKRRIGGDVTVNPQILHITYTSSGRGYTLFHAVSRRPGNLDWDSKKPIRSYAPAELDQHHIFPKAHLLTKYGNDKKGKSKVDDIANIAIISQETNLRLADTPPEVYLREIDDQDQNLLTRHCITRDRDLWKLDRYEEFLEERRKALAQAAQELLDQLQAGQLPT